jgi:hypothetical protein
LAWRVLPELSGLCVVDPRESLYSARFIIKPLPGYGDSCLYAMAYSTIIEGGDVYIVPHWASL